MGDAAHVGSLDHEVYHAPFAVEPQFEMWDTPGNYRRYPGGNELPKQMKVWRVQNSGKDFGGVVARSNGFTDSPDAEVLALGFNVGKEYGAVGIGRQGNFLQWGYASAPSQMTEPGRRLFLNCIHYIRKFDGKAPLVRRRRSPRTDMIRLARIGDRLREATEKDSTVTPGIAMDVLKRYVGDPNGLLQYGRENLEWIYYDKGLRVDEELKALGIDSNRKVETLERLFELANDPAHSAVAKRLLARYTDGHTTFDFKNGRDRIYFTDVGGFKFMVVPEGYLIGK